jgi:hypothetical protein
LSLRRRNILKRVLSWMSRSERMALWRIYSSYGPHESYQRFLKIVATCEAPTGLRAGCTDSNTSKPRRNLQRIGAE